MLSAQPRSAWKWTGLKLSCEIALTDSCEDVVVKLQPFPAGGILAQRNLIQGPALEIIQNLLPQLPARRP